MNKITIQERKIKQISKKEQTKLRILHQKIFNGKIYLYDGDDLIYTCTYGTSNKYIFICQVLYNSPEFHFNNEEYNEKTEYSVKQPYIIDFGIITHYRRKGIGSYMMNHIINIIKDNNQYKYINLDILNGEKEPDDEKYNSIDVRGILLFYNQLGFKIINKFYCHPDRRKRYTSMTLTIE